MMNKREEFKGNSALTNFFSKPENPKHSVERIDLMHKDEVVFTFEVIKSFKGYSYNIITTPAEINLNKLPMAIRGYYPEKLGLTLGLSYWISNRIIQGNRKFMKKILKYFNTNSGMSLDILLLNNGASLNDCYWLRLESLKHLTWDDVSFYRRAYNEDVWTLALIGEENNSEAFGFLSNTSPELTTGGALAKCWKYDKNLKNSYLLKCSSSEKNREPLSEVIASEILGRLGIKHCNYTFMKIRNHVCSKCYNFTDENLSFVPMCDVVLANKIRRDEIYTSTQLFNQLKISCKMDDEFVNDLKNILIVDYLIDNGDRHFRNFGVLIDNRTGEVKSLAPIFDNGMSLLYNMSISDLENVDLHNYTFGKSMLNFMSKFEAVSDVLTIKDRDFIENLKSTIDSLELEDMIYNTVYNYFNMNIELDLSDKEYLKNLLPEKIIKMLRINASALIEVVNSKY